MRLIPHIRGRFALSTLSHLKRANTKLIYVHFNMHPLVDLNGGPCVQEGRALAAEIEQMKKMIVPADKKTGAHASPYKVHVFRSRIHESTIFVEVSGHNLESSQA